MNIWPFKKADTDVTLYITLYQDDSGTNPGSAKTGLTFESAGIKLYYTRALAAAAVINPATQTVTGAHSDGGFVEISATNAPGLYRLDLPDAACATGVDYVIVSVYMTGVIAKSVLVLLNTNTAADIYTRIGAPTGASISADLVTIDSNVDAVLTDTGTTLDGKIDTIDTNVDSALAIVNHATYGNSALHTDIAAIPSTSTLVSGVLDEPISSHTTAGTVGEAIKRGGRTSFGR